VLYTSYRYGWDSQMMGLSLAAIGIMSGLVQGTLIKPIVRQLGERGTLLSGLMFGALGFAIYGLARTSVEFWAGIPVMALWGIAGAATQAMMSQLVNPSEQGQLQGANASIMAVAGLFGPGLFSFAFAWSIARGGAAELPGLGFLLAAALLVLAAALAWQVTRVAQARGSGAS
jgi:MFS transporter, DHA1 family, tetracycline resistance protein